ncbi:LysR family transcriptional regulator [Iodobacter sp. LRB]|uniref:LysR family transcriptional regulator n=1 Tax=unclassified Iodobacter TaxID=235634 RepID=UPI000C0D251F|nr:LysR family transcriptional regulator [Iodobacter sp. BJB302]PHU99569.1 LysR family transcriptional regulator [Iodobacter sp. BJB302]
MVELADMRLFVSAVACGSLSAAGRELGFSPAVGSKRLSRLEADLGVRLLQRSSRRLALTEEGLIYYERCQAILAEVADAEAAVSSGRQEAQGVLRVSSPVALGRRWIGPALAELAMMAPSLTVQLTLTDQLVDLIEGGLDCVVRIGGAPDSRLIARHLTNNRRVICAAPAYFDQRGMPQTPAELAAHDCIVMSRSGVAHADWRLEQRDTGVQTTVRVKGRFATDNGELAHDWALAGLGLVRRSVLDVADELAGGQLVEVLPQWAGADAPVQVLYASRRHLPARVRLFIDHLAEVFERVAV